MQWQSGAKHRNVKLWRSTSKRSIGKARRSRVPQRQGKSRQSKGNAKVAVYGNGKDS